MKTETAGYEISTDSTRLDIEFICAALAGSYWAQGRPRSVIETSIRNSACFGLYETGSGKQVGFARIVTDGATIAWLGDVVIDGDHRRKGLGKWLVSRVVELMEKNGTTCLLATRDAHGLYEKFGFARVEYMKRPAHPPTAESPAAAPSP
jgi:GNAT superfamily N-acetyltransferase